MSVGAFLVTGLIVMATRPPLLEHLFGGLNRAMKQHRDLRGGIMRKVRGNFPGKFFKYLSILLFLIIFTPTAHAAELIETNKELCGLTIEGEIIEGDFKKISDALDKRFRGEAGWASTQENHPDSNVCLNSPGGSLVEGVKIAQFFLEKEVGTAIDDGAECYSICAIMFMMGTGSGGAAGTKFTDRRLHVGGKLGFHRPSLPVPEGAYTHEELIEYNKIAFDSLLNIFKLANAQEIGNDSPRMPGYLINQMISHEGKNLYYIDTVHKTGYLGIEIIGLPAKVGLTEMEKAYYVCENTLDWQADVLGNDDTDYAEISSDEASVKSVKRDSDSTIFEVISRWNRRYEANCFIQFHKNGDISGCGDDLINSGISFGERPCTSGTNDTSYISELSVYKPNTRLSEIRTLSASIQTPAETRPKPVLSTVNNCWLDFSTASIVNVDEYVFQRLRPDLKAPIVTTIPLNEQVAIQQIGTIEVIGNNEQSCANACRALRRNQNDQAAREQAMQCIQGNQVWYQVTEKHGRSGWVSRKFLQEVR